jgi:hypothetical protein
MAYPSSVGCDLGGDQPTGYAILSACFHTPEITITPRQIDNPFAQGTSYPIVFHEIWASREEFEAHCQRKEIQDFFAKHVESPDGDIEDANVCVYTDEPWNFDAPKV